MPSTASQLHDAGVLGSLAVVAGALSSSLLCIVVCAGFLQLAETAEWIRNTGLLVVTVVLAIGQPPIVYGLARRLRSRLSSSRAVSGAIVASAGTLLVLAMMIAQTL